MYRFRRSRPLREVQNFRLQPRQFRQAFFQAVNYVIPVIFRHNPCGRVGDEAKEEFHRGFRRAFIPRDQLDLHLTNTVTRGLCAASVIVEATLTCESKRALDARHRQHNLFHPAHRIIFFLKRQVPALFHINNRLFRFAFHEKFDAVIIGAEIGEGGHDKETGHAQNDQRHHRVAGNETDHPAKVIATEACLNTLFARFGQGGCHRHRGRHTTHCEDTKRQQSAKELTGTQHGFQTGIDQENRWDNKGNANTDMERAQRIRHMTKAAAHTAGNTAHHRQIDQRHNQRGRKNKDQCHRQHAHELPRHTGPEQHRQEGTKRGRG